MGWRLYMALAVLLVLGADVRPHQPAPHERPAHHFVAIAVSGLVDRGAASVCRVPSPGTQPVAEPELVVDRNRRAAAAFGARRWLSAQEIAAHAPCLAAIEQSLAAAGERGPLDPGAVAVIFALFGLTDVERTVTAKGSLLVAFSGTACVGALLNGPVSKVAVLARVPGGGCDTQLA